MFILDTDHVSIVQEETSDEKRRLLARLATLSPDEVVTTIVTYEEQTRGWLAYLAKARTVTQQVAAYRKLYRHLDDYRRMYVLPYDERAASEFQRLRQSRLRIGTLDLKIASVALAQQGTLLTRNVRDFRQVPGLTVEDWTV